MRTDSPSPVTTIFAREVRASFEAQYEEWLAGISRTSSRFAGNQGTTILRPAEGRDEYIAITQFDSAENLELWLRSAERESWLAKLGAIDVCREEVLSLAGMERWFTLPGRGGTRLPPRYKTATLVLLGLYPLVLLLNLVLSPRRPAQPAPGAGVARRLGRAHGLDRPPLAYPSLLRVAPSETRAPPFDARRLPARQPSPTRTRARRTKLHMNSHREVIVQ